MKLLLKSERGSTSILVVIFMIVLMIFGLSILTTSISNSRLAEKKRQWLTEYYALEGQVAEELATLDTLIDRVKVSSVGAYQSSTNTAQESLQTLYYNALLERLSSNGYGYQETSEEAIVVYFDMAEDQKAIPKHIYVELTIPVPNIEMDKDLFLNSTNFTITRHTEWQEPFELDETIKFEDPFEIPTDSNEQIN